MAAPVEAEVEAEPAVEAEEPAAKVAMKKGGKHAKHQSKVRFWFSKHIHSELGVMSLLLGFENMWLIVEYPSIFYIETRVSKV